MTQAFVPIQRLPLAPTVVVTRPRNLRPFQRKVRAQLKKRQARIPSCSSTGSLNLLIEHFGITVFIVDTLFRCQSVHPFSYCQNVFESRCGPLGVRFCIRPEFQLSGVMNGDSEVLHNIRGPTGLAYIDAALYL